MADAARREARRRRILENSENRLQKITGKCKTDEVQHDNSKSSSSCLIAEDYNGHNVHTNITTNNSIERILTENYQNFLDHEFQFLEESVQSAKPISQITLDHTDHQFATKREINCDNIEPNPLITLMNQQPYEQSQQSCIINLLFSHSSCIFLAAFMNILSLANVDISLYKGILIPFMVMVMTRLLLKNWSEKSQDNNLLVAALILLNIKPKFVHTLNKIISLCNMIYKDLALYLVSFVLFNWIISTSFLDLNTAIFL